MRLGVLEFTDFRRVLFPLPVKDWDITDPPHQWSPKESSCWGPLKSSGIGRKKACLLGFSAEACHGRLRSTSDFSALINSSRRHVPYGEGGYPEGTSTRTCNWSPVSRVVRPGTESTLAIRDNGSLGNGNAGREHRLSMGSLWIYREPALGHYPLPAWVRNG